jgi:putative polyhydroxyalkanoate system protein
MATILIRRPHKLAYNDLRSRAEAVARRIALRHNVSWRWEGDSMKLSAPAGLAKGTTGTVRVGQQDVHIEIELPLALRPVRGVVEGRLKERIDALLAPRHQAGS